METISNTNQIKKEAMGAAASGVVAGAGASGFYWYRQKQMLDSPQLRTKLNTDIASLEHRIEKQKNEGGLLGKFLNILDSSELNINKQIKKSIDQKKISTGAIVRSSASFATTWTISSFLIACFLNKIKATGQKQQQK